MTVSNRVVRRYRILLAVGLCSLMPVVFALTNFNLMQSLAKQRFGDQAEVTVSEWQALIGEIKASPDLIKLKKVNDFFNSRVRFKDDIEIWKVKDYWATPLETMGRGAGDCEDYSIAKYITLQLAGVPIDKMRITYAKAKIGGRYSTVSQAHMVLSYYPAPNSQPFILDNLIPDIQPASRRSDLTPVFGFNTEGLWYPSKGQAKSSGLSTWRDVIARMQKEGIE